MSYIQNTNPTPAQQQASNPARNPNNAFGQVPLHPDALKFPKPSNMNPQTFVHLARQANLLGLSLDGMRNQYADPHLSDAEREDLEGKIQSAHDQLTDLYVKLGRNLDGTPRDPNSPQNQFAQSQQQKYNSSAQNLMNAGYPPNSDAVQALQNRASVAAGTAKPMYGRDPNAGLTQYNQQAQLDIPAYGQENSGQGAAIHGPSLSAADVKRLQGKAHDLEQDLTRLKTQYDSTTDFSKRNAIVHQVHDTRLDLLKTYGQLGLREDGSRIRIGDGEAQAMMESAAKYRAQAAAKLKAHWDPNDFSVKMLNYRAAVIDSQLYGTPVPEQPYPVDQDMRSDYMHFLATEDPALSVGGDVLGAGKMTTNPQMLSQALNHKPTDKEVWEWELKRQPELLRMAHMKYGEWLGQPAEIIEKAVSDGAANVTDFLGTKLNHEQAGWFLNDKEGRASQGKAINAILHATPIVGELLAPADLLKSAGEMIDKGPINFVKDYAQSTWGDITGAFEPGISPTVRFNKALTAVATAYGLISTAKDVKDFVSDQMIKSTLMKEFKLSGGQADSAIRLTRERLEKINAKQGALKEASANIADLFDSSPMRDGSIALATRFNAVKARTAGTDFKFGKGRSPKGSLTKEGAREVEFVDSPNKEKDKRNEPSNESSQHLFPRSYQQHLAMQQGQRQARKP